MAGTVSSRADAVPTFRELIVLFLRAASEGLVLLLVIVAPWPFGSVHPMFEFVLLAGVALLLVLWSLIILVGWRFTWKRCPVALCLVGLVLVGVAQLAPLRADVLELLSPKGVRLLHDLKPAQPEQLADGQPPEPLPPIAGPMLSLYPGGTRALVLRLLAVFLLYAAVRNTFVSKESLRRLGFVCMVNGAALSLVGLIQLLTAQRHVVFWVYETSGQVFGPFINRNHFAFFLNISACLTGGLLAGHWLVRRDGRELAWSEVLRHAPSLWLGAFLCLMLVSLACCLSRGGLTALCIGSLVALGVCWANGARRSWQGPALAVSLLFAAGLFVWYVLPNIDRRLAPLWHGSKDARLPVWLTTLTIGQDYPWTGSGYGTFNYMELSRRPPGRDPHLAEEVANNDYLEGLAEGGVARLLLSVAAVGLVFVLGWRAYRRYRQHPAGGWILGALAGFTTIAVHSFFDYGLHVPAVAFLATVLAAHLAALGARRTPDNRPEEYEIRLLGLGPILAASTLLLLAASVGVEGWRLFQAERFRKAAEYRDLNLPEETHAPQVAYLEEAVRNAPDDAALRQALAEAHLWQADRSDEPGHRAAAARQLIAARDLCPLMVQPHLKLAALTDQFSSADKPADYLRRATELEPTDPQLWSLRGNAEQDTGDQNAAWQSWRRSLELSDLYLADILKRLGDKPDAEAIAERLLPENAEMLVRAARLLYPEEENQKARGPLLHQAVKVLKDRVGTQAKDLYLRGQIQDGLGERTAAIASYRLALSRDGRQTEWRYELADLLYRDGRLKEAEDEVQRVLSVQRDHEQAKALQEKIQREAP